MVDCIETAPSGRSKCRACRQPIAKGADRFGESAPNPYGEGETHFWYHLHCAALRLPDKLQALLADESQARGDRELLLAMARNAAAHALLPKVIRADRAPTARARCQTCRQVIDKGELRIVLERMQEGISSAAGFMHVNCATAEVGAPALLERLSYCQPALPEDDQAQLRGKIESTV